MYDLIVLGGGPAGADAAQKAATHGLSCAIAEEKHFGGVCLNEGCIPTKTLLHSAKLYSHATQSAPMGVEAKEVSFNMANAVARKDGIVAKLRKANESSVKKSGADIFKATGVVEFLAKDRVGVRVGETTIEGARLLVCTGSDAIRLPIPGADQPHVYTNREILAVTEVPQTLVVIGGGIIGLEFASLFAELGARVTVIEMLGSIGGAIDPDLADTLHKQLKKKGITFRLNAKVEKIDGHTVHFTDEHGTNDTAEGHYVLMSVGRRPRGKEAGLDALGVQFDKTAISADACGRTNLPNVFVAGDANGKSMLAHTASREADVCIDTILGKRARVNYDAIPQVIYTHPEVASVGLTRAQARERGYDALETSLPMAYSGRYLAETERGRGFVKVVADRRYGTILGVHMIDGDCSELLYSACVLVESQLRIQDVHDIVCAHPTVSEVIKLAVEALS